MQRTNFYKLPMDELEERVKKLRNWWWEHPKDPKRPQVSEALNMAYHALEARKAIKENPTANKQIADAIDVFWGDVPEKYEANDPKPIKLDPKKAREMGLKRYKDGWLFDPREYQKQEEAKKSPKGLV